MEYLAPIHYKHAVDNEDDNFDFIVINEYNKIVISNCLKDKVIRTYTILHSNNIISYCELSKIDNAISTINMSSFFIILLNDGSLIFILKYNNHQLIKKFKRFISFTIGLTINNIGLSHNTYKFLLFSVNILYVIKTARRIVPHAKVYSKFILSDVIGCACGYDYLLTVNNNNGIECWHLGVNSILPLRKKQYSNFETKGIKNKLVLNNINVFDVKYIHLSDAFIIVLFNNGSIWIYTYNNIQILFYYYLLTLSLIKTVEIVNNNLVCFLENGCLLISELTLDRFGSDFGYNCTNSSTYSSVSSYSIRFDYMLYQTLGVTVIIKPSEDPNINKFLEIYGSQIDNIVFWNWDCFIYDSCIPLMIFVIDNCVKIIDVLSLEYIDIGELLYISEHDNTNGIKELKLIDYEYNFYI